MPARAQNSRREFDIPMAERLSLPDSWQVDTFLPDNGDWENKQFGTTLAVVRPSGGQPFAILTVSFLPGTRISGTVEDAAWVWKALSSEGYRVAKASVLDWDGKDVCIRLEGDATGRSGMIVETALRAMDSGAVQACLRYPADLNQTNGEAVAALRRDFRFSGKPGAAFAGEMVRSRESQTTDSPFLFPSPAPAATPSPNAAGGMFGLTPPGPSLERPTAPGYASSASRNAASDFIQQRRNTIIIVSDEAGGASGFIAKINNKPLLVTNIHVIATPSLVFRTLDREQIKPGRAFAAVGRDVLVMELGKEMPALDVMADFEEVRVGDEVFVLGNPDAAGVMHPIFGQVVGLGPELVEVDAPFVPGNSGSPIIHAKTGKVLGVATYLTVQMDEFATNREPRRVARRFGYRLDGVKTWQPVDWKQFFAEKQKTEAFKTLTEDLAKLVIDIGDNGNITPGRHQNPAFRTYVENWARDMQKDMVQEDRNRMNQGLMRWLKNVAQRDITSTLQGLTYDFFVREAKEQERRRGKLVELFDKIANAQR